VKSIAGLLLAAGASSRMGRPKQLLPLGRWSLLEHAIRQALGSDIDVLFLVLGSHAKEIRERLAPAQLGSRLRIIENPRFGDGISTSIISGIRQIEPVYEHTLILLGDMPWITSDLINHLIEEYLRSGLSLGAVRTGIPAIGAEPRGREDRERQDPAGYRRPQVLSSPVRSAWRCRRQGAVPPISPRGVPRGAGWILRRLRY